MKTIHVHTILVWNDRQKHFIQIKLPRNTKKVTGIKVTALGTINTERRKKEVGWLWLRIPEYRDVFFAEIVEAPNTMHGCTTLTAQGEGIDIQFPVRPYRFGEGLAWVDGTMEHSFSIDVDGSCTIIEGYYTNVLSESDLMNSAYDLKIYLTLESHD